MTSAPATPARRVWLILGVAVFAYVIAVMQRSSLGVAAVEATDRFGIAATALSSLAVVQIAVYAALQIPVGVVLDRIGARRLIAIGAALMAVGQMTLAVSPNLGVAIVGRVLVGAGDAMTFISAIRLVATWVPRERVPLVSQVVGSTGQLGQVLSAFPLALVLHTWGWTSAYLSAASVSVVVVLCVLVAVRNSDGSGAPSDPVTWRESVALLRQSLSRPGTQLGFWTHFVSQSSVTVFVLLWGFPFLSIGMGYGPTAAAALITLTVIVAAISGPVVGVLTARFPLRRSSLVLIIVATMAIAWGLVLAWPGKPPLPLVIALIVAISIGGTAAFIGIDFARSFNPLSSLGSATGVVNVGGFTATLLMTLLIGIALDLIDRARGGTGTPAELYSLTSFRIAFLVQYLVVGAGVVFLLHARHRTRRRLNDEEGIVVAPLWVALFDSWRRRRPSNRTDRV